MTLDDPEVKSVSAATSVSHAVCGSLDNDTETTHAVEDPVYKISAYFSDGHKMQRALAWLLRFLDFIKDKTSCAHGQLTVSEVKRSRMTLIKAAQMCGYPNDVSKLLQNQDVNKSSHLCRLKPFGDIDGLMHVSGRLHEQHPIIIPHDDRIAAAIVWYHHEQSHVAVDWTLSLIREKFWIVQARPLVKRIIHKCVRCRMLFAKPCVHPWAKVRGHFGLLPKIGIL